MQKNERFHAINKSFMCAFYSRFIHRFHNGLKEQIDIGKSLGDLPDFVEDLWGFCAGLRRSKNSDFWEFLQDMQNWFFAKFEANQVFERFSNF
jgi:hypothetical protein